MIARILKIALLYLILYEIFSVLPSRVSPQPDAELPPVAVGAIHLPIARGDMGAKLNRLTAAAAKGKLDFLVVANLDRSLPDGAAGTFHGVDVYPEIETSTPAGHALLFHGHTSAADFSDRKLRELAWRHFLGTDTHKGVFLVVAHPSSFFTPWERLDRSPDGIELINLRSLVEKQAVENPFSFALTLLVGPFNPFLAALRLFEPNGRDLRGWDAVNEVSPGHFGIVATDDLSDWPLVERTGLQIPPWEQTVPVASNVVYLDGPPADTFEKRRAQVYRSLREGKSALLLQAIHPFAGNDWSLACGAKRYRSGDKFALLEPGCEFVVRLPPTLPGPRRLVLLREGQVVAEVADAGNVEKLPVDSDGAYRLEVHVRQASGFRVLLNREVPYLYYNPLYVR